MTALSLKLDTPQLAQSYEERSADRQFRHGQRLIADLGIRAGEHVLDIGSGTGLLAAHVANLVGTSGSVLGIDPLPLRIEIAKRKAKPGLTFQVGNAYALDQYPSEHLDVVYLNSVFHWLPEKREPLKQIFRILKPNGRLGITTGSKDHQGVLQLVKKKVLEQEAYSQYPDPLGGRPFNVDTLELAQLLEETGFELSKIELQDNVQFQPTADAAIEFSEASSFGNFLGHLPESLRARAAQDIKKELESLVTPRGPLSAERFMDGVALGQVTPGPIVITATFFGHQSAGILGSLAATAGVFFPSFALVIALAPCFERLQRFTHFGSAMRGATLSFVGLLVTVALRFIQTTPWTAPRAMVATASVVALRLNVKVPWVLAVNILLEKLWWDLVNSNLQV